MAFEERFKRCRIKCVGKVVCSGVEVEKSAGGIGIYLVAEVVNTGEDKVFFGLGCADCVFVIEENAAVWKVAVGGAGDELLGYRVRNAVWLAIFAVSFYGVEFFIHKVGRGLVKHLER